MTVDAFVLFLESEPGYGDKSLYEAEMSDLHKANDLNSVFRIVKNRCSWFNHSFLGNIIKAYCNDNKEIKTKIISTNFMSIATTVFVLS